jgi:hypothetical protein
LSRGRRGQAGLRVTLSSPSQTACHCKVRAHSTEYCTRSDGVAYRAVVSQMHDHEFVHSGQRYPHAANWSHPSTTQSRMPCTLAAVPTIFGMATGMWAPRRSQNVKCKPCGSCKHVTPREGNKTLDSSLVAVSCLLRCTTLRLLLAIGPMHSL